MFNHFSESFVKSFPAFFCQKYAELCKSAISSPENQLENFRLISKSLKPYHVYCLFYFSNANMPSFKRFLSFFPVANQYFLVILYAEHLFLFLKCSTFLFATVSSESSLFFFFSSAVFLNILKSFFVGFETFLTSCQPPFLGMTQRTNSLLFLPK